MRLGFSKLNERQAACTAVRDDGVTVRVPGYGPITPLPHDLAHYVVECELRLGRGFWASVAAGALFPGMCVLAGRQRPHASERSRTVIRENGAHVGQAELLVGEFVQALRDGRDGDLHGLLVRLAEAQSAARAEPLALDATEVARVCAALRAAAADWQALAVTASLSVDWPAPVRGRQRHVHHHARRLRHAGRMLQKERR